MNREPSKGISWGMVIIVLILFALFVLLALPTGPRVSEGHRMAHASNNARMILICLKAWAGENQGNYPDSYSKTPPETANEAFRLLVQKGIIEDERIFTAPVSPFTNDNNIGEAPDYLEAVESGENHWCLVKGLNDQTDGNTPVVFENPVKGSWPPAWNADSAGKPVEGRAWKKGKVIIGRNDGSVRPEELQSTQGAAVPLKKDSEGKDLFTRWLPNGSCLDVER